MAPFCFRTSPIGFTNAVIFVLRIVLDKGKIWQKGLRPQHSLFLVLLSFGLLILSVNFSGLILAKLFVRIPPKVIDSIDDLRLVKT